MPIGRNFVITQKEHEKHSREVREAQKLAKSIKHPIVHIEVGHGAVPIALMKAALKQRGTKRKRLFLGIETKEVTQNDIDRLLRANGVKKAPRRLKLIREDALKQLEKTPSESVSSIRAVYVVNNMAFEQVAHKGRITTVKDAFFKEASRTLKKGGMLFVTNDQSSQKLMRINGENNNLKLISVKPLTDYECDKSLDPSVRMRAKEEERLSILKNRHGEDYNNDPWVRQALDQVLRILKLSKDSELTRPTIYTYRKK